MASLGENLQGCCMTETNYVLLIFIVLLLIEQLVEFKLLLLNLDYANKHNTEFPPELDGLYDDSTQQKSLAYTKHKTYFSIFSAYYSLIILFVILFSGFFAKLDSWWGTCNLNKNLHGTAYLLSVIFLLSILQLPAAYYSAFVLEERFGFNKTSRLLWAKDQAISLLISALVAAPLISLILHFMSAVPHMWWLYASISLIFLQMFLAFIFPIWIAPLFNKFSPLEEGELKQEIVELVGKIGYQTTGVFSVDGSKRSKHANAYFAGLGKSKRIVLFDTLINLLSTKQILAVLAHEIGHEKLGHIKKSLLFSSAMVFAGFYLLNYFYQWPAIYKAFGFAEPSNHAALLIFSLVTGPIMYFVSPTFNFLSRKFEYQADRFAIESIGSFEPLSTSLAALSKNSLSNLTPHPWYSFMHYSHPTLIERIGAMRNKP